MDLNGVSVVRPFVFGFIKVIHIFFCICITTVTCNMLALLLLLLV